MKRGILQVAGIGPGKYEVMIGECAEALKNCDCIAGYELYIQLVKSRFPAKEFYILS